QQFRDFEILVVDGGSTDATIDIVQDYQKNDDRISYISEPDRGVYDGMNKGILRSSGIWLLFVGSDDFLYSNTTLGDVASIINTNPQTRFVYGDVLTSRGNLQRYVNYNYLRL